MRTRIAVPLALAFGFGFMALVAVGVGLVWARAHAGASVAPAACAVPTPLEVPEEHAPTLPLPNAEVTPTASPPPSASAETAASAGRPSTKPPIPRQEEHSKAGGRCRLGISRVSQMKIRAHIVSFLLPCLLAAPMAHAQTSGENKAAAEALFEEGRKLMDAGQLAEACPKLEKSDAIDPAPGTQLNLASCYEKLGKTASSWATYKRAAASARARGQSDREKIAVDLAQKLEARLSRLNVVVPPASKVAGLSVRRNGTSVDGIMFGQDVPVDPGPQTIEASAPGHKPWSITVTLGAEGDNQRVTVPALDIDPNAANASAPTAPAPAPIAPVPAPAPVPLAPPPSPPPEDTSTGSGQRTLGLVVAGVGVVGLGVGGIFALSARSKYSDSKGYCLPSDPNKCNSQGVSLRDDARSAGNVATVLGGVGLAALVGGAVLYFTAPSSKLAQAHALHIGAGAAQGGGQLSFSGIW